MRYPNLQIVALCALSSSLSMSLASGAPKAPEAKVIPESTNACTGSEQWKLPTTMSEWWVERFAALKAKPETSAGAYEAFAQGMMLKETAKGLPQEKEFKALGEYWMSRSLFQHGQIHLAFDAFSAMVAAPGVPETLGVRRAALQCLKVIQTEHPYFKWRPEVVRRLKDFPKGYDLHDVAALVARDYWGSGEIKSIAQDLLTAVPTEGPYYDFVAGLISDRRGEAPSALEKFTRLAAEVNKPKVIADSMDIVFLAAGRAAYEKGEFSRAADFFVKIPRESNYLPKALSDLSWSYLSNLKYREAMGTSFNLQKSYLRGVFSPESPLVMAIALNELCQYPLAIQSVNYFRKRYNKTYQWLYNWKLQVKQGKAPDLYRVLVDHLQGKNKIPDTVAGEWARSPLFIAAQEEINLIRDEQDLTPKLLSLISGEKRGIKAREYEIAQLHKQVRKPANAMDLEGKRKAREALRNRVTILAARKQALSVWEKMLTRPHGEFKSLEGRAVARIQDDFERRNEQMFKNLLYVNENTQLVEIEIFDGAAEDIVWQNAHPDYKEKVAQFKNNQKESSRKVWRWNKFELDDPDGEVWEDELGWFRGEVPNECENKNKYLEVKATGAPQS